MNCIVTAGPTYEPLDQVRRLTNFSTGRLGTVLADTLAAAGHEVTLLLGELATWRGSCRAQQIERFTTVDDLRQRLRPRAGATCQGVFHAAAVSDFRFGQVFERRPSGTLHPVIAGKIPTRVGSWLAELVPTPKVIGELRDWYPNAFLVGWKYEVDGGRDEALSRGRTQLADYRTDLCVVNGPAYGSGFGLVPRTGEIRDLVDVAALAEAIDRVWRAALAPAGP